MVTALWLCTVARAHALDVTVVDQNGDPVPNAVVFDRAAKLPSGFASTAEIHQRNQEFEPGFLAVGTGTKVNFPNHDKSRHHVYSFSAARSFEIKLYSGVPADPVLFDKPGLVTLGCNLHDWMIAYLYVVDSDNHVLSDEAGSAVLIATNTTELDVMHPYMSVAFEPVSVNKDLSSIELVLQLRENVLLPSRPERNARRRAR